MKVRKIRPSDLPEAERKRDHNPGPRRRPVTRSLGVTVVEALRARAGPATAAGIAADLGLPPDSRPLRLLLESLADGGAIVRIRRRVLLDGPVFTYYGL